MVGILSNLHRLVRAFDPCRRESRTQEIDALVAKGKIPIDVDLSEHPENSVKARPCMFLMLYSVQCCKAHSSDRAHGEGCRNHQRYQDCSRNVSRIVFSRSHLLTAGGQCG